MMTLLGSLKTGAMDPFSFSPYLDVHIQLLDFIWSLLFALLPLEWSRMLFKTLLSRHKSRLKETKNYKWSVSLGISVFSKISKRFCRTLVAVTIETYLLFKLSLNASILIVFSIVRFYLWFLMWFLKNSKGLEYECCMLGICGHW